MSDTLTLVDTSVRVGLAGQRRHDTRTSDLIILKLGGSILTGESDLALAVHEIYRHIRAGTKVVTVVSALHGATDRLLARARRFSDNPDPLALATLLSTGELTSASLLSLALDRSGIPSRILDAAQIQLCSSGPTLDSTPTSVNAGAIRAALNASPVVIIPGFVARDEHGNPTLLGRGGSDLTALFLARELVAPARLLKDVPGIFESDPNLGEPVRTRLRRFETISWPDLETLGGKVVQSRTATFARKNKIPFELGAILSDDVTRIGAGASTFAPPSAPPRTLRVALLGHGTVGAGVARSLRRLPELFALDSIAVRDPGKHSGIPRRLLTTDAPAAIDSDADIVIELIGGVEPARTLIARALASGKHVVTANKAVIAAHGDELRALAESRGVRVLYSAAVGGALPILETARRTAPELCSIEAILNGATNYILTRMEQGASFAAALNEARARGLTEADPARDLSGQDALDKLTLIARELWPDSPVHTSTLPLPSRPLPGTRQIARLLRTDRAVHVRVRPEVPPRGPLSNCERENNAAIFTTSNGAQHVVTGKGAGRFPTTESVMADLLDLARTGATVTWASC